MNKSLIVAALIGALSYTQAINLHQMADPAPEVEVEKVEAPVEAPNAEKRAQHQKEVYEARHKMIEDRKLKAELKAEKDQEKREQDDKNNKAEREGII